MTLIEQVQKRQALLPAGRGDMTDIFMARACPSQIATLTHKAAAYGGLFVIYAGYNPAEMYNRQIAYERGGFGNMDRISLIPMRRVEWFGAILSGERRMHFQIGADHFSTSTNPDALYMGINPQEVKAYDYGHEVYPYAAPAEYRTSVDAERRALHPEDYYDGDDDDDYEDEDDD